MTAMRLHLGVRDAGTGAHAEVVVEAPAGTRLADVADRLRSSVGAARSSPLHVQGACVPGETLLGAGPLVQGAVLDVGAVPVVRPAAPLSLSVVGGPGAGACAPLAEGLHVVGREGPGLALCVPDGDISRRHLSLEVSPAGVRVADAGSTNGSLLDGTPLGRELVDWPAGTPLRVGASTLTWGPAPPPVRALPPTGDGCLAHVRRPRVEPRRETRAVVLPVPPQAAERAAVPWLALLGPLALGAVLWRVTGSLTFLLFTLMSPVLVVGQLVSERRSGRRRSRRDTAAFRQADADARAELTAAVLSDQRERRARAPDLATVVLTATHRRPALWQRRLVDPDQLVLRLGLADQPADVVVEGPAPPVATTTARQVPAVVDLAAVGVLGLTGPDARALARSLVLQAAVATGPRDLQVVVLADPTADGAAAWGWTRWLPHARPDAGQDCTALLALDLEQAAERVAELEAVLIERLAERDPAARIGHRRVLLVVDGPQPLRGVPGLARLLSDGPAAGICAVCVSPVAAPPGECGAVATLTGSALTLVHQGRTLPGVQPDLLSAALAEHAARALAPLRDTSRDRGGTDGLPARLRWTEAVGLPLSGGPSDVDAVAERWGAPRAPTARAVLGRSADGLFAVDLTSDGPHALVAGTTGSGKSELLQTWVASLALAHRPDELALVLVDYKGGAAFGPCTGLPHVVGVLSDLDGALVERALGSLSAELTRREAVLASAAAPDLDSYRRLHGAGALPRLVLVVDEFAALAGELPDFVPGLVGIAQRGRSLGVHLVLATQRPEGVISADIRANTNLRICLSVADAAESRDVLDSPVAAALGRSTPGRAYARSGPGSLTAFQTARVGGPRPSGSTAREVRVHLLPAAELGSPVRAPAAASPGSDTSDLDLLVRACRSATDRLDLAPPDAPWLPPLPAVLLADPGADQVMLSGGLAPLRFGLVDVPARQSRRPLQLDLDSASHLLVLGAPRSGRSTVLRALAAELCARSADDVHLYVLDLGGSLTDLALLPHTAGLVSRAEPVRALSLLRRLAACVTERQDMLSADGHAGITDQRAAAAPADRLPHLVLLLDRWEAFLSAFGDLDAGRLVDLLLRLLQDGPAVGLHVVITGDRTALVGRLSTLIGDRLVLRLSDPGDYAAAGVPARLVPGALPPGRGWVTTGPGARDGAPLVAQVSLLDRDLSGPAQAAALERLARQATPALLHPPVRLRPLPRSVRLADVQRELGDSPPGAEDLVVPSGPSARAGAAAPGVPLGVGGDDAGPVVLDPAQLAGGMLVAGPAGSGRSTALVTMAHGLLAQSCPVWSVCPRVSALRDHPGVQELRADEGLAGWLESLSGPSALLVDDAELLTGTTLGAALDDVVRVARDRGLLVVAAGTTPDLLSAFRGFVVDLRRARTGLLLAPTGPDGDLLGVRLGALDLPADPPPGRGLLVRRGAVQPVQVADGRQE